MTANLKVLTLAVAAGLLFTVGAAAKNIHFRGISCVDTARTVTCSLPASTYPKAQHWTVSRSTLTTWANGIVQRSPFDAEGVYQHLPLLHSPGAYAGIVCKTGITSPTNPPYVNNVKSGVAFVVCTPDDLNSTRVRVYLFATPDGKIPSAQAGLPCPPPSADEPLPCPAPSG